MSACMVSFGYGACMIIFDRLGGGGDSIGSKKQFKVPLVKGGFT